MFVLNIRQKTPSHLFIKCYSGDVEKQTNWSEVIFLVFLKKCKLKAYESIVPQVVPRLAGIQHDNLTLNRQYYPHLSILHS